jgi:hypothetical protein
MAIAPHLREGAFLPEATAAMGEAFDAVCNELYLVDESKELRPLVATGIIAAARQGEIDPVRLRMKALAGFFNAIPPSTATPRCANAHGSSSGTTGSQSRSRNPQRLGM